MDKKALLLRQAGEKNGQSDPPPLRKEETPPVVEPSDPPMSTIRTATASVVRPRGAAGVVARIDVASSLYPEEPNRTSLHIYNNEVFDFLGDFSRDNARAGGAKIKHSMILEVLADVAFYDMGIRPDGIRSVAELRQLIQSKLKA